MLSGAGSMARIGIALFLAALLIFVAGCTGSSPPPAPQIRAYTPQTTILIGSTSVNPQVLTVEKGVTVTWLNIDMGLHTVASDAGDPDSFVSYPLSTNDEFQWTFTLPGTYGYHCTDNPNIKGTIIVSS